MYFLKLMFKKDWIFYFTNCENSWPLEPLDFLSRLINSSDFIRPENKHNYADGSFKLIDVWLTSITMVRRHAHFYNLNTEFVVKVSHAQHFGPETFTRWNPEQEIYTQTNYDTVYSWFINFFPHTREDQLRWPHTFLESDFETAGSCGFHGCASTRTPRDFA